MYSLVTVNRLAVWILLSGLCGVAAAELTHPKIPLVIPAGLIEPDVPIKDALTQEKVDLGRKLFFDARLSKNNKVSCATCHAPEHGFAEDRSRSISADGILLRRNAPSVLNMGYATTFGWDGRFKSLEHQLNEPFSRKGDMALEVDEVLDRLDSATEYADAFRAAFGDSRPTSDTLRRALAAYQRALISSNSRFDSYLFEGRKDALTAPAQRGWRIFSGKGSCVACHDVFHKETNSLGASIALFSDHRFHNLGVGYENGRMADVGRYYATKRFEDWGAFKTPMLRNVALTAPYMHDGSIPTLREVIEFYNRGGIPNPNLSSGIQPLFLAEDEINDLVSFLESLTDQRYEPKAVPKQHTRTDAIPKSYTRKRR